MNSETFCYHCRRYHPSHEVLLVDTRSGQRWRCLKSISAGKTSEEERDAFGRMTHRENQERFWQKNPRSLPHCVRDFLTRDAETPDELTRGKDALLAVAEGRD